MLLLASMVLLPTLSRALAAWQGAVAPWAVVCSAVQDGSLTPEQALRHLGDHCPACSLQSDGHGLPAGPACGLPAAAASFSLAAQATAPPVATSRHALALPRAPPVAA